MSFEMSILQELNLFYISDVLNNVYFLFFFVVLFIDLFTGNIVALYQRRWNSKTGINGTIRHLAMVAMVYFLLPIITFVVGYPYIADGILLYIIGQYIVSILENLSALGWDLDDVFTQFFEYLGSEQDKTEKQNNKKGE